MGVVAAAWWAAALGKRVMGVGEFVGASGGGSVHRDCSKATVPGQWYSYAVVKDQGAVFTSEEETVAFVFQLRGGDEVAACPWHKVVVNMEVPSESMVKQGITTCTALAGDCPVYKVPFNKGIEEHNTKLRLQGRIRSRGKLSQTSIKDALTKRPKLE